jgi:hypothetical protein
MNISSEDAVMLARACLAWYGPRAARVVSNKIKELRRAGDHGGVVAWSEVAGKLAQPADTLDFVKRPAAPSVRRSLRIRPLAGGRQRAARLGHSIRPQRRCEVWNQYEIPAFAIRVNLEDTCH